MRLLFSAALLAVALFLAAIVVPDPSTRRAEISTRSGSPSFWRGGSHDESTRPLQLTSDQQHPVLRQDNRAAQEILDSGAAPVIAPGRMEQLMGKGVVRQDRHPLPGVNDVPLE
jgi:hypothetical protein